MLKRKIKILHIIPNFTTGGAERLVVELLKAFDRQKFNVAACSLYGKSNTFFEKEFEKYNIPIYYLGKRKGLDLRMILQLHHLFCNFKPDIVNTHLYTLKYVLFSKILYNKPVYFHTIHSIATREAKGLNKIANWIAFNFFKVVPISISKEIANTVKKLYRINTPVIYNGIFTKCYKNLEKERFLYRKKYGIKNEDIIILNIANFKPGKNHRLLISAFEKVTKIFSNVYLFLIGEGKSKPFVEKTSRDKKLSDKVRFLGLREDIPEWLSAADIFVLSSDWEGLPMVVLEAMASGKPVIVTAVGGIPELIKNGETGLLVSPQNTEKLVGAMIELIKNPTLRKELSKKAKQVCLKRFDISNTARAYEELYINSLKQHKKI